MKIAETVVLATIVDSEGQPQEITATLESLEGIARWVLRCGGEDAQCGAFDTLEECLTSAMGAWGSDDWQLEFTDVGSEIIC